MWNPRDNSDDDNLRWCRLRALEWLHWPIFISQPFAPVALLFFSWWSVIVATLLATVFWIFFVRHKIVMPVLAWWGASIVWLKWISSPVAAYLLWRRGAKGVAIEALCWPLLTLLMIWLFAPLLWVNRLMGRPSGIEDIQNRFMQGIGYEPGTRPKVDIRAAYAEQWRKRLKINKS